MGSGTALRRAEAPVRGDGGASVFCCHAIIRPGLIVGSYDPSGRFTYWPIRIARGCTVLAPAPPDRQLQFIDVRDLGDWIVRLAEGRTCGTYNAAGPMPTVTFGQLLDACRETAGHETDLVWVDERFLLERGVVPWMELPLWTPEEDAAYQQGEVSKALAAGLHLRPGIETVRDTLEWASRAGAELVTRGGFREQGCPPLASASFFRLGQAYAPTCLD